MKTERTKGMGTAMAGLTQLPVILAIAMCLVILTANRCLADEKAHLELTFEDDAKKLYAILIDNGYDLYTRNFAFSKLQNNAGRGDIEACYLLGMAHANRIVRAESVPVSEADRPKRPNYEKLVPLWIKAAEAGHVQASLKLGNLCAQGIDGKPDIVAATRCWLIAAEKGNEEATNQIKRNLTALEASDKVGTVFRQALVVLSVTGDASATVRLGKSYMDVEDYDRAKKALHTAVEQKSEEAKQLLAEIDRRETRQIEQRQNVERMQKNLRSPQGLPAAPQIKLAEPRVVTTDPQIVRPTPQVAPAVPSATSADRDGPGDRSPSKLYAILTDINVPVEDRKAAYNRLIALGDEGNPEANFILGEVFLAAVVPGEFHRSRANSSRDDRVNDRWEKAAAAGHVEANLQLGNYYARSGPYAGSGISNARAIDYWIAAAQKGNREAISHIRDSIPQLERDVRRDADPSDPWKQCLVNAKKFIADLDIREPEQARLIKQQQESQQKAKADAEATQQQQQKTMLTVVLIWTVVSLIGLVAGLNGAIIVYRGWGDVVLSAMCLAVGVFGFAVVSDSPGVLPPWQLMALSGSFGFLLLLRNRRTNGSIIKAVLALPTQLFMVGLLFSLFMLSISKVIAFSKARTRRERTESGVAALASIAGTGITAYLINRLVRQGRLAAETVDSELERVA